MSRSTLVTVCAALAVAHAAPAADTYWIWNDDGVYGNPAYWSPGSVPGADDRAIMQLGGTRTIDFLSNHVTDQLRIERGDLRFDLNGYTYALISDGSAGVADRSLQLSYGMSELSVLAVHGPGTFDVQDAVIGTYGTSNAVLWLLDGCSMTAREFSQAGLGGEGYVWVLGQSQLTVDSLFLSQWGTEGTNASRLTVGDGSSLSGRFAAAGATGPADLDVFGTAEFEETVTMGTQAVGEGHVRVEGAAAQFTANELTIGAYGDATMAVDQGATATVNALTKVASQLGTQASMHVGASGSGTFVTGALWVGVSSGAGLGEVIVHEDGLLDTGTLELRERGVFGLYGGTLSTGTLEGAGALFWGSGTLDIDGPAHVNAAWPLGATLALTSMHALWCDQLLLDDPGTARVDMDDGFVFAHELDWGPDAGTSGTSLLNGDAIMVMDHGAVGGDQDAPGGSGSVTVKGNATCSADSDLVIWPGGVVDVEGDGSLLAKGPFVIDGGTVIQGSGQIVVAESFETTPGPGLYVDSATGESWLAVGGGGSLYTTGGFVATEIGGDGWIGIGNDETEATWTSADPIVVGTPAGTANWARINVGGLGTVAAPSIVVHSDGEYVVLGGTTDADLEVDGFLSGHGPVTGEVNLGTEATTYVFVGGPGLEDSLRFEIGGTMHLDGELVVVTFEIGAVSIGDSADVMTSSHRAGMFDRVRFSDPDIADPLVPFIEYTETAVRVRITHRADANRDGVVDIADLLLVLSAWGVCDDPTECPVDTDGDGVVGVSDLLDVLANWS